MAFYDVTLNKGRTDTIKGIESNSLLDIKTFFQSVSEANITKIKKILFSKDLGIGTFTSSYLPNNEDLFLNILVKNKSGLIETINIQNPKKDLTEKQIIASVKKYVLLNNEPIIEVLNILVKEQ